MKLAYEKQSRACNRNICGPLPSCCFQSKPRNSTTTIPSLCGTLPTKTWDWICTRMIRMVRAWSVFVYAATVTHKIESHVQRLSRRHFYWCYTHILWYVWSTQSSSICQELRTSSRSGRPASWVAASRSRRHSIGHSRQYDCVESQSRLSIESAIL